MRSAAATTSTSSRAPFSASCREFRRSTTSACSPAATTWTCCAAPASGATSIATTTPRENCRRQLNAAGRAERCSHCCGSGTRTRHFSGTFRARRHRPQTRLVLRVDERRRQCARLDVDLTQMCAIDQRARRAEPASRRAGVAIGGGGTSMTRAATAIAQPGRRQDADLSDVRHVRDDDRLGRHHHSRSHQDVPVCR